MKNWLNKIRLRLMNGWRITPNWPDKATAFIKGDLRVAFFCIDRHQKLLVQKNLIFEL